MQYYGCVFCRTGREIHLAEDIKRIYPQVEVIVPHKLRNRRQGGQKIEEKVILFPAYVFVRADEYFPLLKLSSIADVYRVLCDSDHNWYLTGKDEEICRTLFQFSGCVGFSKAHYEGDRIVVGDGFLKGREGDIVRVNRKAGTAQVKIILDGKIIYVWCGLELQTVEPNQTGVLVKKEAVSLKQLDNG